MATCCGADRATAFCPDCGEGLLAGVRGELAQHVRRLLDGAKNSLRTDRQLAKATDKDGNDFWRNRAAEECERVAELKRWLDWVLRQGE